MHPIYTSWPLWVGTTIMLVAMQLSYMRLRGYSADEWASLTGSEQRAILRVRSYLGGVIIILLWVLAVVVLGKCDGS